MPSGPIDIRPARCEDLAPILAIQKTAFLDQARIYQDYELPPLTQSLAEIVAEFERKVFLKALHAGAIIASVRYAVEDGCVHVDRLVVAPERQNRGVGRALLAAVEARVPEAEAFRLFTGAKSARNLHLYRKLGYRTVAREMTAGGIELVHMEKRRS